MTSNRRVLRSSSIAPASSEPKASPVPVPVSTPITFHPATSPPPQDAILIHAPTSTLPHLTPSELKLLRKKQSQLRLTSTSPSTPLTRTALNATLIFAQHEAGTAVLIHASGWALTCAHCFGDTAAEYNAGPKRRWMLFYTGDAVLVECRAWDPFRDLALLRIVGVEADVLVRAGRDLGAGVGGGGQKMPTPTPTFHAVKLHTGTLRPATRILCIGQPGRDDLESANADGTRKKTPYALVEVSQGAYRGMVPGVDAQDNREMGTLMHDAWTYWGHSGAPLVREVDGALVGLHSSWDEGTGMRHGVPAVAVGEFLGRHLPAGGMTKGTAIDVDAFLLVATPKANLLVKWLQNLYKRHLKGSQEI
ncbi:hypothetical protein LCER1_G007285 [Lachnellula cervina]|uniref:Uncharacterized protein n=1 Tax=Lachnellula cervina TaxID=1316786 RepID=A0A7D8YJL1_9HELO|nr:hypothetical protein LCER1_G007285 [Lachnellula cervina]